MVFDNDDLSLLALTQAHHARESVEFEIEHSTYHTNSSLELSDIEWIPTGSAVASIEDILIDEFSVRFNTEGDLL